MADFKSVINRLSSWCKLKALFAVVWWQPWWQGLQRERARQWEIETERETGLMLIHALSLYKSVFYILYAFHLMSAATGVEIMQIYLSMEICVCACFSVNAPIGLHICSHACQSVCKAGGGVIKTVVALCHFFFINFFLRFPFCCLLRRLWRYSILGAILLNKMYICVININSNTDHIWMMTKKK